MARADPPSRGRRGRRGAIDLGVIVSRDTLRNLVDEISNLSQSVYQSLKLIQTIQLNLANPEDVEFLETYKREKRDLGTRLREYANLLKNLPDSSSIRQYKDIYLTDKVKTLLHRIAETLETARNQEDELEPDILDEPDDDFLDIFENIQIIDDAGDDVGDDAGDDAGDDITPELYQPFQQGQQTAHPRALTPLTDDNAKDTKDEDIADFPFDAEDISRKIRGYGKNKNMESAFTDIEKGAFTRDAKRHGFVSKKTGKVLLPSFSRDVISHPEKYSKAVVKRARFYRNLILPRKGKGLVGGVLSGEAKAKLREMATEYSHSSMRHHTEIPFPRLRARTVDRMLSIIKPGQDAFWTTYRVFVPEGDEVEAKRIVRDAVEKVFDEAVGRGSGMVGLGEYVVDYLLKC